MIGWFTPEALHAVYAGFSAVCGDPLLWLLILAGTLLGMVVGVLPGFGPPAAMALLFPLTYVMPPLPGIAMLAGIFYGAKYGGAVTSILLGIPGETDAVATLFEGHPLALAGKARQALAAATLASFCGGMTAVLAMAALAPFLTGAALYLGPTGRFALMIAALALVALLGPGGLRRNAAMVFLGLILALPGMDPVHGMERMTLGGRLWGGVELGSMLLGLFGIGDILDSLFHSPAKPPAGRMASDRAESVPARVSVERGSRLNALFAALRGSLLGFAAGLVPCGAGVTASFASHALEKKLSRHPESFGKGAWAGLTGPEASNNAAAVASFAPLLLLGLPTNPIMAALLGALTVGGIVPGPRLPLEQGEFYWGLICSLALGNFLLLALGLGLARVWAALARLPWRLVWPCVLMLCLIGSYTGAGGMEGPVQCVFFGALSVLLRRGGFSPAPLVLAFVLGPRLESGLFQMLMGGIF